MGRVVKKFTASTPQGSVNGLAKIDPGADRTTGKATRVRVPAEQDENLIGDDFFRGSRSKLDYGRPGREFSGLGRQGKWRRTSRERARYGQRLLAEMCKR
jgi:hypothetical protein